MFIEVACSCTAAIQFEVDKGKEDAAWLFLNRFANAHVECGFVSPLFEEISNGTVTMQIPTKDVP